MAEKERFSRQSRSGRRFPKFFSGFRLKILTAAWRTPSLHRLPGALGVLTPAGSRRSSSKQKVKRQPKQVAFWRRRRDLNSRAGFPTYALSRGASSANLSTSPNYSRSYQKSILKRKTAFCLNWRRGWDSNPRALSDKRFSRPPRYDHFDTSPRVTTAIISQQKTVVKNFLC